MTDIGKLTRDIAAAPLGDLIASVGRGVAEAQAALDAGSMEQTLALQEAGDDITRLMRETGYRPTFYAIPETTGELSVALTVTGREGAPPAIKAGGLPALPRLAGLAGRSLASTRVYAAPIDGSYRNSYGFTGNVGAKVTFRIVAVPPPSAADAVRVVPDISGQTVAEASRLLESFDLVLTVVPGMEADAVVAGQTPSPGAIAREGDEIDPTF